jgi:hypothetical protein
MLYSGEEACGQSTYILLYSFNTFYRCFNVVFLVAVLIIRLAIALTVINFWMRLLVAKGISKDSTFATSVIAGFPNSNLWAMLLPIFLEGPPCNDFCGFNICFPQEVISLPLLVFSKWWGIGLCYRIWSAIHFNSSIVNTYSFVYSEKASRLHPFLHHATQTW